jgi:hypothetical protein
MPPLAGREVPGRLIVVGVDGVDAAWLASLLSRVDVPTLREIARRGVSWTLRPDGAAVPPEAWTTFATGVPGEVHGIRSYEVRRLPGMRSPLLAGSNEPAVSATLGSALRLLAFLGPRAPATPLSSGLRRSRAIWELMSAAGSTAAVINWWATWPADAEGGLTVSDRAFGAFLFRAKSGSPVEAAEGGREAAAGGIKDDALVQPAALLHELESEFPDRWKSIEARYAALVRGGAAGSSLPEAHEAFLIDAYHLEIADRILEERKPHGLFVYLPGQDIILGSVAGEGRAHPAAGGGDAAGRLDEALKTVSSQEILLAELESGLSRFVARMSPSDIIVLLFDPGRFFREEKGEATRGQLFLFGDRIQASGPRGEAGALDVAPTLLTLAGLPLSRELPGRPVGDLSTLVSGLPDVGFVPNYGDRPEGVAGPEGSDDFLDRLRSLGYIQ